MSEAKLEALVKRYFKKDEHLVLAIMGFWGGVGALAKLSTGGSKPAPAAEDPGKKKLAATPASTAGGFQLPTAETLDTWLANESNIEAWVKSLDTQKA